MCRSLVVTVMVLSLFMQGTLLAQEEDVEYSWGTLKSLSSNQIVVMEYDYDREEDVEVTYSVDPKVEIKGVNSLKEIEVGDSLEIEYLTQGDKRTIKVIAVERASEAEEQEEEYTPSQTYEEDLEYPAEERDY